MWNKKLILVYCIFLLTISLAAQCVSSDSLWKKIVHVKDSLAQSPELLLQSLQKEERNIERCGNGYDSTRAFLLRQIGVLYYNQANYIGAANWFNQSAVLMTLNEGKPSVNPKHLISNYYWLALMYDSLNNFTERMKALENCISAAIRLNSVDIYSLSALYKRVEFFYDIGDYHNCIRYAEMCESLGKAYANQDKSNYNRGMGFVSSSFTWHINSLLMLRDYDATEKLLLEQLNENKRSRSLYNQGALYAQFAQIEQHKGNFKKARSYLDLALLFEKKAGNDINCKTILNNIGYDVYFTHLEDADSALIFYKKAFSFTNKNRLQNVLDSIESMNILTNIANVYVRKRLPDSAFKYFQLAFEQMGAGTNETKVLYSPLDEFNRQKKIGYLTNLLIDKADALVKLYKSAGKDNLMGAAIRIYKITDQLLDKIKREQSDLQSKLFWRSESRRLYEHAIGACFAYNDQVNAFYFFEKSRAVLLNDQLNEQRWLGEREIFQQTQVKKVINNLERQLNNNSLSPSAVNALQKTLFEKRQQLDSLVAILKMRNPLYFQSFLDTSIIGINEARKKILTDHVALLEIFVGDSAVYSLAITSAKNHFNKLDKIMFDSLSNAYISFLSSSSMLNRNFESFSTVSRNLYQLVLGNIELPEGRIIISPYGKYFPFESLVVSKAGQPVKYLLEKHAVSYTYSVRYLFNEFPVANSAAGFLGIAPVRYPATMRLAALNGSDRALEDLKSYFSNADILLKQDASKSNFLSRFSKYTIIQLYTHASAKDSSGEPAIYFSDSVLYFSDLIEGNKPVTSLIVLSACETGSGKLYQGEGVFSFNRAFAAFGIPSSVTNLWIVEDESIYLLTKLFYKYLSEGMTTDEALREAKLEFIKKAGQEKRLPYYWAASILVGTDHVIKMESRSVWKWMLIIGLPAILVIGGVWRSIYNRNNPIK